MFPLAGVWVLARLLEAFGPAGQHYTRLAPVAGLVLSCTLLWGIFERSQQVARTPSAAVAEAFIGYLIVAIAFAQLYWILIHFVDKPFNQFVSPHEVSTLLYFSLVTISSVGYGVIAPNNPYVRMVAAFEGVAGIFIYCGSRRAAGCRVRRVRPQVTRIDLLTRVTSNWSQLIRLNCDRIQRTKSTSTTRAVL